MPLNIKYEELQYKIDSIYQSHMLLQYVEESDSGLNRILGPPERNQILSGANKKTIDSTWMLERAIE